VPEKNQQILDLLKRVDREGAVALQPIALTPLESELIGNAISVNPYEPLMHYMKLEYFMQMLAAESLHVRRLDTYEDDPLEGLYPDANKRQLSSFDSALLKQLGAIQNLEDMITSNRIHRQFAYVHCWFGDRFENRSMWEKYGGQGHGVCLQTTASRLEASLKCPAELLARICRVTYLDEGTPIPTHIGFLPFSRKQTNFKDEKEFRLIAEIRMEPQQTDADGYLLTPDKFRALPVNLEKLLEAVVAGPNSSKADLAKLEVAVAEKISGKVVRPSQLPSFWGTALARAKNWHSVSADNWLDCPTAKRPLSFIPSLQNLLKFGIFEEDRENPFVTFSDLLPDFRTKERQVVGLGFGGITRPAHDHDVHLDPIFVFG
jgi:hypothetical protein